MLKIVLRWQPIVLFALFGLGLVLRLYGLNWDQSNSFHPDERQILFHVVSLRWPSSWAQFFDPDHSPLNPHFFAYGSFPLYLLAGIGALLHYNFADPQTFLNLTLIGRGISAFCDSLTILLIAWLALLLENDKEQGHSQGWITALLAAALTVFIPLQLQLAHFYAVDSMLLLFVVLTVLAAVAIVRTERVILWSSVAGIAYGLALGTKFSAAPLAVLLILAAGLRWYRTHEILPALTALFYIACLTIIVFLLVDPYAFLDRINFVQQVSEQGAMARGLLDFPYVRQFAGTIPYVYEANNIFWWGMGICLSLCALLSTIWLISRICIRWRTYLPWLIVIAWILIYSAITGSFYVKFMRYMLPVYPFLTLCAAAGLAHLARKLAFQLERKQRKHFLVQFCGILLPLIVLGGTIFQGLALLNVYSQPNTRIEASRWIYQHLRPGSILTYEQWDDPLPLPIDGHTPSQFVQKFYASPTGQPVTGLDLYSDDTIQKAHQLAEVLSQIDVITMASDRLDKSIPRLPQRYPLTIHYYQLLYSGQLGFQLAAQFDNRPHLLGLTLDDSVADESYSVFDHPTCRIFVRKTAYTADELFQKLMDGLHLP